MNHQLWHTWYNCWGKKNHINEYLESYINVYIWKEHRSINIRYVLFAVIQCYKDLLQSAEWWDIPGNFLGFLKGTNFAPIANAMGGPNMKPRASIPRKSKGCTVKHSVWKSRPKYCNRGRLVKSVLFWQERCQCVMKPSIKAGSCG